MSKLIFKIADHYNYDCGLFCHSVRIWVVCFCMVVNVPSFSNCVSVSVNLLSGQ